jgi:cell wall-associated NlpC family hydrolase
MKNGICYLSVIPVRENPSDKSQMTSQLLYGETVEIDDVFKNWYYVRSFHDGYKGWIDKNQIKLMTRDDYGKYSSAAKTAVLSRTALVKDNKDNYILLSFGTGLLKKGEQKPSGFDVEIVDGDIAEADAAAFNFKDLKKFALMFKNVPYLWGGRSFFGVDCSGFIQLLFMTAGYNLPRDSKDQVKSGDDVYLFEEARPGDLLFFGHEENQITHVGMLLEKDKIIHASGKVRIDRVDHYGIYNDDIDNYTHKLRAIQRIL